MGPNETSKLYMTKETINQKDNPQNGRKYLQRKQVTKD